MAFVLHAINEDVLEGIGEAVAALLDDVQGPERWADEKAARPLRG